MRLPEVLALPQSEYDLYRYYLSIYPPAADRIDDMAAWVVAGLNGGKYPYADRTKNYAWLQPPLDEEAIGQQVAFAMQCFYAADQAKQAKKKKADPK